ncbi:MAG: 5-formyltetrahydrofolate cyclo-ligase, partial [Pseudonocardiaceae bacterium]
MTPSAGKQELRRAVLAARAALPIEVHAAEAAALASAAGRFSGTVCAYHPVGSEPGSAALLDALRAAGCRVLLPVVTAGGPLEWAEHSGSLRAGPLGLLEPDGPRLGAGAIATAGLVLVPALAVD